MVWCTAPVSSSSAQHAPAGCSGAASDATGFAQAFQALPQGLRTGIFGARHIARGPEREQPAIGAIQSVTAAELRSSAPSRVHRGRGRRHGSACSGAQAPRAGGRLAPAAAAVPVRLRSLRQQRQTATITPATTSAVAPPSTQGNQAGVSAAAEDFAGGLAHHRGGDDVPVLGIAAEQRAIADDVQQARHAAAGAIHFAPARHR